MSDSLSIPALSDLRTQAAAAFDARLQTTADVLRRRNIKVAAEVFAGLLWSEYKYLQTIPNAVWFVTTAVAPYLDRKANELGITRGGASTAAGNVIFTGTSGITIPAFTWLQNGDASVIYVTQAPVTLASGAGTVAVVAQTAGSAGNASPGAQLGLMIAVAGVAAVATADGGGITGGADAESDASLRKRLLARLQNPPQVGAASDFYRWTLAVPGVTRAWIYPLQYGNGTLGIAFVMDARANPVPLAADIAAVQAAINAQIDTVTATAWAPTGYAVAVTVHGLAVSGSTTLAIAEAAITAAIADLNATRCTPGGAAWGDSGLDVVPGAMINGGQVPLEAIYAAIADVPGVTAFDLTAPTADIAVGAGFIPRFLPPTFT